VIRTLARFAIAFPITVTMGVLAVLLLGYISFGKLGMDIFPDLNNPRIYVELKSGERPPEEIEKMFVTSIESQAIRLKGVVRVSSVVRTGFARMTVEYAWNTAMDEAFLDLQKGLKSVAGNKDIDEFTVTQQDPNAAPIAILGFSHPDITDMDELRKVGETSIRNELVRLEGIAEVELLGTEEKEVQINTDEYRMEAYGVTPSTISSQITSYNRNVSGGSIVEMGTSYVIKGVGELANLDEIRGVIVSYRTQAATGQTATTSGMSASSSTSERVPVYLRDVATVELKNKRPENIVRVNGQRCVGIAVYKETRYNTVRAVNELFGALDVLKKALPGYQFTVIQNQGEFVQGAINEVKQSALIGVLLSILVLFVFLRRIGTTLIISVAIPVSIIATFNLMYFNGLTINIMTLGGLALGAGMLVDNAIIVMESIFRNLENKVPLREAAVEGTAQVGGAINASTITTIVVFLPIVYLHGAAGELFKDQAWTVAFSLLSSLAVAVLVIPMLSAKFLKSTRSLPAVAPVRFPRYRRLLEKLMDHKWKVIGATALLMAGSFLLIPKIGSEFLPKADTRAFTVDVRLPEGTEIERTADAIESMERIAREALGKNIQTVFSVVGPSSVTEENAGGAIQDENTASMRISLAADRAIDPEAEMEILRRAFAVIPDTDIRITPEQTAVDVALNAGEAPLVIEIQGEDLDQLKNLTDQVKQRLTGIGDLSNIRTSFDKGRPEVEVVLDRERAGAYNVGIDALNSQLTQRLTGTSAGQWETGGDLRDISILLPKVGVNDISDIVITAGTREVPVGEVTSIRVTNAPSEIDRKNQVRIGTVSAELKHTRPLDHVVGDIRASLAGIAFPPDYRYNIGGEEEKRSESFGNLKFAFLLSFLLMFMVLASQFESVIHPFTILFSVPTAITGTVFLFYVLGMPFTIMAYIGIIMLIGIAVNDSIILVDAVLQLRRAGMSARDAVLEAGQRRLRPIIMTSLTTVLGMLPLTFAFGEGASLRAPMALAVVGGMITSTLLTLVVIPCVYLVMDRIIPSGKG
jgi:hydrophobic/amphiphilic exporter-1 (mainly G- bacteria), HAE1 family